LERLKAVSGGRLDLLPLLPGGSVSPAGEQLQAASSGVLDVSASTGAFYTGTLPIGNVETGLSFSWKDGYQEMEIFYEHGLLDLVRREYAKQNVHYLGPIGGKPVGFMTNFEINTVDDIKGKKLRVTGEPAFGIKELGASITEVDYGELYLAMQQGVIDGLVSIYEGLVENHWTEVAKYAIFPPIRVDTLHMVINMDTWNELPDDLKKLFEDQVELISYQHIRHGEAVRAERLREAMEAGVIFMNIPDAELAKIREISLGEGWAWAASQDAASAEAVEIIKKALGM
jgi:TRAP-type C4-dicarboxylate transport system substrate-binding protein